MSEDRNGNVTVALGDRRYEIRIGRDLLRDRDYYRRVVASSHVVIVSNETVASYYLDAVRAGLEGYRVTVHLLPDGEQYKTVEHAMGIVDNALSDGASRDCTFIALGGGVVGDMTGFAAACFMRGVAFVQIPTTLLAQVDSSVGGKTGVNHPRGKNLIGAFHQPIAVLIDTDTLGTLSDREFSAGLAEVIKYGAIIDAAFFGWLEEHMPGLMRRDGDALRLAIRRSCELKAQIVVADERERGQRALLNFGHTFGHAIEACTQYSRWVHGEAVAAGMILAAQMSGLPMAQIDRLVRLINAAGLPTIPNDIAASALHAAMGHDKKVQRGRIRLILLHELGKAYVCDDYSDQKLMQVLEGRGA